MSGSFNFPNAGVLTFGRRLAVTEAGGDMVAATQMNRGAWSGLLVRRQVGDGAAYAVWETPGAPQEPALAATADGAALCLWNEIGDGEWRIRAASVARDGAMAGKPVAVAESARLLLPPAAAAAPDGAVWAAWSAREDDHMRIHTAVCRDGKWHDASGPECAGDSFRPSVACTSGRVVLAWDEYVDDAYRIAVAEYRDSGWVNVGELGGRGERWMCPRLATAPDGSVYLCAVVMVEVDDEAKGIADHFPFAAVARVDSAGIALLTDPDHPEDERIAADMREGLLASRTYMGYHGLRRNPALSVSDDGTVNLFWEVRVESEANHIAGHLAVRRVAPGGFGECRFIHDGGYSYAVSPTCRGATVSAAYFLHSATGNEIVQTAELELGSGVPYRIDPGDWARWRTVERTVPEKPTRAVAVGGDTYHLFWADTHCHGVFSPDAEGETDELIHFGRDLAGLDAICVIDNDYYPHKTLSDAEWQVHQELCRHATVDGGFVAFPGWEFTYHRDDLSPSYNHRCVIYPRSGGRLFRRTDPEASTDAGLFEQLKGRGAMCYPHHCTYRIVDPELDWNVEVTSSWRVCLEETDFTIEQLRQGARIGFVGSSDSHRSIPGLGGALTALYAKELTPEALFDAYRRRRTLATQGFFMFADFRVGGLFIGEEGACEGAPVISLDVQTPEEIEYVDVMRDGETILRFDEGGRQLREEVEDAGAAPGTHFYMLRVKLVGDPGFNSPPGMQLGAHTSDSPYPHNLCKARGVFAWSSPIWVDVRR